MGEFNPAVNTPWKCSPAFVAAEWPQSPPAIDRTGRSCPKNLAGLTVRKARCSRSKGLFERGGGSVVNRRWCFTEGQQLIYPRVLSRMYAWHVNNKQKLYNFLGITHGGGMGTRTSGNLHSCSARCNGEMRSMASSVPSDMKCRTKPIGAQR